MSNFWKLLPKPFLVLAPMEDVTDVVFREIVTSTAKPDVFFTEFTSSEGLCSRGRDKLIEKLRFTPKQHPIVAQIWGKDPKSLQKSATLIKKLGFDGIDINMGCPKNNIMKKYCGAAQIGNYSQVKDIIMAVKDGAQSLPVSVKTRLGINSVITKDWISFLLKQSLDALIIHGRIAIQMSQGQSDWSEIGRAVKLKNAIAPETVIIGNGDINSFSEALVMKEKFCVDGVMIGRGIFANPWVFEKTANPAKRHHQTYINLMQKHILLYEKTWGVDKNFHILKKFFKMYVNNFEGASDFRSLLMGCKNASQALETIKSQLEKGWYKEL